MDEVLDPGVVGVTDGRFAVDPALVAAEKLARPVADVEGRVGEDEVGLEVGVLVAEERVGRLLAEPGLDAVDGEVHVGEAPRRGVALLPEDGDVGAPAAVGLDKLFRLDEHAPAAAGRIVDTAVVRLQHLDEHPHDTARRVELAAQLSLGCGEFAEEVLVDSAKHVASLTGATFETDIGDQVDETFHLHRLNAAASVVAGELALEVRVITLDCKDRIVDQRGDVWSGSLILKIRPSRFLRHPKDALSRILVAGFKQAVELFARNAVFRQPGLQFVTTAFEAVGNVLEEQQAQNNVLVLGGIDLSTEGVGGLPQSVGVVQVAGHYVVVRHQDSLCCRALESQCRPPGSSLRRTLA